MTAQRHGQNLQKVPIAISTLSAAQLEGAGVSDTQSLAAQTPGLIFSTNGPSGTVFIRGVGSNAGNVDSEPSVALCVDDVYIASPTGNQLKLNNIEQIAVLKGPQGTLFGRNATGGVIQVKTRDPDQTPSLDIEGGYGNFNTFNGGLYASTPITSNLAADIAVVGTNQGDGWGHNVTTGSQTYLYDSVSARSKIVWTPSDDTKLRLSLDFDHSTAAGTDDLSLPGEVGADGRPNYIGFYNSLSNTPSSNDRESGGASLRVDHDFGEARFVSISAFRDLGNTYQLDEDKTALTIVNATLHEYARTLSQEVQLLSPQDSKIDWLVGAFAYHLDAGNDPGHIEGFAAAPFPYLDLFGKTRTTSGSIYGQATAEVYPDTHLTAGYRYTIEKQNEASRVDTVIGTIEGPFKESQSFDKGTWRLALDHQFTTDILGYVSYNRGIKSGGFDLLSPGSPGYHPEQLDAYEIGAKDELLDHRLRINTSAFYYNYKDIQEERAITGGTVTINAARASIYGFDFDVKMAATDKLTVYASGTYLNSTFDSFLNAQIIPGNPGLPVPDPNVIGKSTPQAPDFTGHLGATYRIPTDLGDFQLNGDYSYNDGFFWDSANRLTQPAYSLVNMSVAWSSISGTYGARVWANNVTDTHYYASGIPSSGLGDLLIPAAPRTFGVTVSAHF